MPKVEYASKRVGKCLLGLPSAERERILRLVEEKLSGLSFLTRGVKRYHKQGRYRLRVGDYRVVYSRHCDTVTVYEISPRKDTYKKR